ncbi:hypothetical protein CBS76997_9619 [Aspergillus niger]|nr:hypothetical protein CBS11350_1134 [Aspergillus niger]KAI2886205.1 hypothetical protein CBS13152_7212 [Aspergillus niger]KAI2928509.1 hypothetical protein CBS147320_4443 [Aspergillus niger]KAI3036809.1 hypothetical protein CBS76997_9619 [Aspergillus niger]
MAGAKETSNTPQRGRRASKGCRTTGPVAAGGNNGLAGKENTLPHNNTGKRSQKGKSRGRGRDNIVRPEPADRDSRAGKTSRSGYRPLPGTSRVSSSEAPASDELSAAQMQVFLEAGLAMIDESPDTRRTFIESLATESGLRKVRQIVETDFAISYSVLKPMFDPHCILFFQLVSHNEVLSSLILEKAVGTIYNVIYGPGGRRAIGFFTKVTDYLTQFKSDGRSPAVVKHVATPSEVLSLVSRVLLGTLTLNHEAAIQVDLKKIADKLYDCCHADNADARAGDDNLQLAYENILKIQEIFSMGDSIPMSQKPDQVQKIKSNQQDSTRYIVDLPGELSDHGPRHDNDKTAISDIQILPTKSEILNADRPEFLPARCATGSANMHHEWGIRRLLDSQFRLLREDTSGVLREGIRLIIHAWELIVHGTDWRLKRKFLRDKMPTPVRVYSGVEIRQIKSEQFKGIEVNLEFDQLPRLKNVSPAKRKQWWFDSKALKKGPTLLALLDAEDVDDTSAIYFLVSKRETSYVDKDKQGAVTGDRQEPGPRIKGLPRLKDESRVKLLSISSRIDELLKQAQSGCHSLVLGILKKRFPAQASRISSESPGETDTNALQAWVSGDAPGDWSEANIERSIDRLLQEDVWTLKASERTRLLNYWQEAALAEISQQVLTLLEAHSAEKERYTSAFSLSDVQRLNNCQVVGVTTTQLANNAELLRNLNAKVLICEEAAEVLESHVLTALIPSIQHAILIGDHLQLRPRISNLRLSMDYERENPKYNLDESLFERLANFRFGESTSSGTGGQNQQEYSFPVMQLSHQRRMHPSISELVRETLYPKLQDHPTMTSYPLVPGIARRLFWLDHCNVEDPTDPTEPMQSKTNTWEIGMVTALVRHLCQQGKYGPGEIAVLTPYVGQLRMLRNVLEKEMTIIISETDSDALDESEGLQVSGPCMNEHGKWCGKQRAPQKGSLLDAIRLATVDNFQGEEASVVIVSLVRSNRPRNCGFLKMPNRINVLLSALSAQPLCKDLQRIVPSMRRDMRMGLNIPCDLRCRKKLTSCGHQCPGLCGERCPDSRLCRICGGPDILEQNVDLIELKPYKDINVDEDPLVFLSCGHFYTASSLDGIMGMSEHYEVEPSTGRILGPKLNHRLFDSGRPKGCPQCRAPLRDIDRYNRIIKQAFLDEATKKFATHASIKFGHLVEEVEGYEKDIIGEKSKFVSDWYQETVETRSADDVRRSVDVYRGRGNRLLNKIKEFTKSVAKSEQPFGRVSEMLASVAARKAGTSATPFQYNESDIQTGFQSRGHVLALRLTWVLFWNYDSIYSNKRIDPRIKVTLAQVVAKQIGGLLSQCEALTKYCQEAKFLQQEVETRTYHVLFSVLSLSNGEARGNPVSGTTEAKIREKALKELEACDAICLRHSKILWSLHEDIDKARRLVNGGTFYSCVTSEERRQVYQAMAAQFNGTGHWYYCENNHPFAVGECGMPMEESRCPQCEAPVGGLNHEFAQGIRRADDMDVEFGGSLSLEAHTDL